MVSLNEHIKEYSIQLSRGNIQKAYKGIMTFMSELKASLNRKYPNYAISAVYPGYMDMTYFAFSPPSLKEMRLKIAIVFLHEPCIFEVWLAGKNREIQAKYIKDMSHKDLKGHSLSQVEPCVDAILSSVIIEKPDFDHPEELRQEIESKTMAFIEDMNLLLNIKA